MKIFYKPGKKGEYEVYFLLKISMIFEVSLMSSIIYYSGIIKL